MSKYIVLAFGSDHIDIDLDGKNGSITSTLHDNEAVDDLVEVEHYNAAIDGIESLILAHACAGIDVESEAYKEGIKTALDAISNNL